jgi:endonuclease/exonuclease/phosphatase family metal-dependent hydrolase
MRATPSDRSCDLGGRHLEDGEPMDVSTLQVLTWNVMGSRSAKDLAARGELIAAALGRVGADVVLLQEAWPELLETLEASCGLAVAASSAYQGGAHLCAVLARSELGGGESFSLTLPGSELGREYGAVCAALRVDGRTWGAVSAHLPWGGRSEAARVAAVVAIGRRVDEMLSYGDGPVLLGADMNATPGSAAWRILTGSEPPAQGGPGPFWVDAWAAVGAGDGFTTGPTIAPLAARTATAFGSVRPELEPPRRIDAVFSRGWCYGRVGGPVSAEVVSDEAVRLCSDHLPVLARTLR